MTGLEKDWKKSITSCFGHVKCEKPVSCLSGSVKSVIGYTYQERVWAEGIDKRLAA